MEIGIAKEVELIFRNGLNPLKPYIEQKNNKDNKNVT